MLVGADTVDWFPSVEVLFVVVGEVEFDVLSGTSPEPMSRYHWKSASSRGIQSSTDSKGKTKSLWTRPAHLVPA